MSIRCMVELIDGERAQWQELTRGGDARVRRVKRAQILWAAQQRPPDTVIADTVGVGTPRTHVAGYGPRRSIPDWVSRIP